MSLQLHHQVFKQDKDAPWVVLIHGLFGNLDNLTVLRKPLAEQYNVITIDLPDHGESPHVDAFSLSLCVEGISALLDAYDIPAAHIVGHSLGGKAAMMTALMKPEKVLSLVVLDISPVNYPPHHQTIFAALKHVDLSVVTSRKDADQQLQAGIQEAGVRQFLLKSLYQNDAGDWQWRFNLAGLESNYTNISRFEAIQAQKEKLEKLAEIKQQMADAGIDISDLQEVAEPKAKRKSAGKKRPVKYKITVDGDTTAWTGVGRMPVVFKQALENGKSLEDFAI